MILCNNLSSTWATQLLQKDLSFLVLLSEGISKRIMKRFLTFLCRLFINPLPVFTDLLP